MVNYSEAVHVMATHLEQTTAMYGGVQLDAEQAAQLASALRTTAEVADEMGARVEQIEQTNARHEALGRKVLTWLGIVVAFGVLLWLR